MMLILEGFTKYYLKIQFLPQRKHNTFSLQKIRWLMLFRKIIAVCSENHTKPTNTLCAKYTSKDR
jgi:hypothetical protein